MKRTSELSQEFSSSPKEQKTLERAFDDLVELKQKTKPSSLFRATLWERLDALAEIQTLSDGIQTRRKYLYFGSFVSLFCVLSVLYFMSESLFYNPISWQENPPKAPVISEWEIREPYGDFLDVSNTFSDDADQEVSEDESDSSTDSDSEESVNQDNTDLSQQESESEVQESEQSTETPLSDSLIQESTGDTVSDASLEKSLPAQTQSLSPVEQEPETRQEGEEDITDETLLESDAIQEIPAIDAFQAEPIPVIQEPAPVPQGPFQIYCTEVWGILNAEQTSCSFDGILCTDLEFLQNGGCYLAEPNPSETQEPFPEQWTIWEVESNGEDLSSESEVSE